MKDFATNFMEGITGAGELTLLAPSNEAFRRLGEKNLNALLANQQKLTDILQLHVIRRRLSSDEIIQNPLFSHVNLLKLLLLINGLGWVESTGIHSGYSHAHSI